MTQLKCSVCGDEWNKDGGPRGGQCYSNRTCSKGCARAAYTALFLYDLETTLTCQLNELRGVVSYIQHGS